MVRCPLGSPHPSVWLKFRNRTIVLSVWRNQTRIAWKFLSAQNPQSTGSGIQMTALETLDSDDMSVLRGLVIDHVHRKYRMSQTPGFPEEIKDLYRADADNLTRIYRKLGGRLSFAELCPSSMREAPGIIRFVVARCSLKEGDPGVPHDTTDAGRAEADHSTDDKRPPRDRTVWSEYQSHSQTGLGPEAAVRYRWLRRVRVRNPQSLLCAIRITFFCAAAPVARVRSRDL